MTNPFPPPQREHRVTVAQARALMGRRPPGLAARGGGFPREVIDAILAQPGCAGIRFYYGANPDGTNAIVVVGIDESGADMTTTEEIYDNHYPCPPFCDEGSALR